MTPCQHQRDVERLVQLSLARPRSSTADVVSSKMLADETMAACQVACGAVSPYHDVELHPILRAEAAALVERGHAGHLDILIEEFADLGRSLRAGVRRLLRRPGTVTDTGVTHAQ